MDTCSSVATVPGRQHLRSAGRKYLVVPRHRLATYGRRTFVIAGPSAWNDCLMNCVTFLLLGLFLEVVLKRIFSFTTSAPSALEVFHYNALYKFMFTITITWVVQLIKYRDGTGTRLELTYSHPSQY